MIFSLFGRKESKTARKRWGIDAADTATTPTTRSRGESTGGARGTDPREIARQTAAKIDEIESQMISATPSRGMVAPRAAVAAVATTTAAQANLAGTVYMPSSASATSATPPAPPVAPKPPAVVTDAALLDQNTSTILGDSRHANSVEIADSELLPVFEEAAVLYSNGQASAATTVLWQAIKENRLGSHAAQAWLMLFDLFQVSGRKTDFESLAIDYTSRFERSPPTWDDADAPRSPRPKTQPVLGPVAFGPALDAQSVRQLEQAQRAAQRSRSVTLDFAAVQRVDATGCDLLLRATRAFARSDRELLFANIGPLETALRASVEAGRRDASDACWMMLLELLRLQGRRQEFEDLSIEYCVTYEVSPPSWEPMPPTIALFKPQQAAAAEADAEPQFEVGADAFALRGEVEGRIKATLAMLRDYAASRAEVVIDCRRLRRLDFVAAGELLNEVVALRTGGKYLVFRDLNHLTAALLAVMGIPDLAEVRVRKN